MKKFKPYLIIIGVLLLIATVSLVLFKTIREEEVKYSTEDEKYQEYYDNLVKKTVEQRTEYGKTQDIKVLYEALPYFDLFFNDINISLLTENKRNDYEDVYHIIKLNEEEFKSKTKEERNENLMNLIDELEKDTTQVFYLDLVESYDSSNLGDKEKETAKSIEELKGMSEEEKYLKKFK